MRLPSVVPILFVLFHPAISEAASVTFEGPSGQTATWKSVGTPTGTGAGGYWDRTSYDSAGLEGPGACAAAMLVAGVPCDWVPRASAPVSAAVTASRATSLEYFGVAMPAAGVSDAPGDFYFTGPFELEWDVLFQLTAWNDAVEFGWYTAGNPDARTPLAGPGGPLASNDGTAGRSGTLSLPDGAFGFYYRNARFGTDVLFFTQSRFNRMGGYVQYFGESQFARADPHIDDERILEEAVTYTMAQQFIVFRQGANFWLGLEDQIGRVRPTYCADVREQPCADYDFNDLLVAFSERVVPPPPPPPPPVPEPAIAVMLAAGVAATARGGARRRSR